jgi:soluble cytochrome b562
MKISELLKNLNCSTEKLDLILVLGMSKSMTSNLQELKNYSRTIVVVDANEHVWKKPVEQMQASNVVFHSEIVSTSSTPQTFYTYNLVSYDGLVNYSLLDESPKNLVKVSEYLVTPVTLPDLVEKFSPVVSDKNIGLVVDIGSEGEALLAGLPEFVFNRLAWCLLAPGSYSSLDYSQIGLTFQSFSEELLNAKKWFLFESKAVTVHSAPVDDSGREIELAFLRDENQLLESQSRDDLEKIRNLTDALAKASESEKACRAECLELKKQVEDLESLLEEARDDVAPRSAYSEDLQEHLLKLNAQIDLLKELLFGRTESLG